ncbi:fimbrial protein [Enterobacter sp. 118C5]|uniref:fimbrial protein n=1 Tax=Enterobacter TaxID=547 RepID=UPI002A803EF4|nr:fimbrial protein [Enterobacter sp. 118C5]
MLKSFFLFILLMVAAANCQANGCAIANSYPVFSFTGPITVSPSAAIGSAIATGQTQMSITDIGRGGSAAIFGWAASGVSGVTFSQNGARVVKTNLSGIGISVWSDNSIPTPANVSLVVNQPKTGGTNTHNIYYALVKTSNVISSGTLNSLIFSNITFVCSGDNANNVEVIQVPISITGSPTVSLKACTVNNTAINVPFGMTKNSAFTGIGSTANTQTFNISLTCSQATNAKITLSPGSSGAFNAANGVINLDPATTGTTATGVGIQLLYKNTAAPLNSAISVGSMTAAGNMTVPLSARYYQTASKVTGGVANGTATFTMTYN